jgi:hypothetical protein
VSSSWHDESSMFIQSGIGDGQHASVLDPSAVESSRLALFKDGELVGTQDAVFEFFPLPNEAGRFRLEQEWTLGDAFDRSDRARTVWTFDSAPSADPSQSGSTTPPLITLDYGADVDELGRAGRWKPLRLQLRAGHVSGAVAPDRIAALRLQWSVDGGGTWHRSSTRRTGRASFRGTVPGTALRAGGSVSLRVVATDAAGNAVDQTVLGIVPVR